MSSDRLARVDERLATIEAFGEPGAPFVLELPEARALVEIAKAARDIPDMDTPETDALYRALARLDSGAAEGDA